MWNVCVRNYVLLCEYLDTRGWKGVELYWGGCEKVQMCVFASEIACGISSYLFMPSTCFLLIISGRAWLVGGCLLGDRDHRKRDGAIWVIWCWLLIMLWRGLSVVEWHLIFHDLIQHILWMELIKSCFLSDLSPECRMNNRNVSIQSAFHHQIRMLEQHQASTLLIYSFPSSLSLQPPPVTL